MGEIRRTRTLLGEWVYGDTLHFTHILTANHEKDDWINGERTEDIVAFLDRLYTAKRKVEKRIEVLGGASDSVSVHTVRRLNLVDLMCHCTAALRIPRSGRGYAPYLT